MRPTWRAIPPDGACREAFTPAALGPDLEARARHLAATMASILGLVGAMAVELFIVDGELLLNELAVRPQDSGQLSIEACATSQFENHLRAVLDLPLGAAHLRMPGPRTQDHQLQEQANDDQ